MSKKYILLTVLAVTFLCIALFFKSLFSWIPPAQPQTTTKSLVQEDGLILEGAVAAGPNAGNSLPPWLPEIVQVERWVLICPEQSNKDDTIRIRLTLRLTYRVLDWEKLRGIIPALESKKEHGDDITKDIEQLYVEFPLDTSESSLTVDLESPMHAISSTSQTVLAGTPFPIGWEWLVQPESSGTKVIRIILPRLEAPEGTTREVSGGEDAAATNAIVKEIKIVSMLWFDDQELNIIRAIFGILGFLLSLPLANLLFARLFHKDKSTPGPS